jgi:hypothetical protein
MTRPLLIDQSPAIARRSLAVFIAIVWNVAEARKGALKVFEAGDDQMGDKFKEDNDFAALKDAYLRAVQVWRLRFGPSK